MNHNKLIIEEFACWGCRACEVACKQEHDQSPHGDYNPMRPGSVKHLSVQEDGPKVVNGKLDLLWRVKVCKHCSDPVCATACPEGAIATDAVTGIVLLDQGKCNGCGAIPQEFGAEKQGTSPCKVGCPVQNNVQGFVNLTSKGRFKEALQLIKETSPFPSICGRVCHHPCESACNRTQLDEAVNVRSIERFLADLDLQTGTRYRPEIRSRREEKIAVIGSGPGGLTCAYYLALEGYRVTVFEKAPVLGGMLSLAIPAYRLPRETIASEIQLLRDMGVNLISGVEVGRDKTISELRDEGFIAFFLAIGAQKCLRLGIEGEDLDGVYGGLDYLRQLNLGEPLAIGKEVAVIGGGNTAMDAVRSARRSGAENAFILYRRGLEEMPARAEEIQECREEGIPIHTLTQPRRFIGEKGRVVALECIRMCLGDPDATGRRRPEPVSGSEFIIKVDTVINALGQEAEWACLTPECACTLTDWGTMKVDPLTLQTDDPDIFAGGDAVRGPQTVIEAIADGRQAAISIDRYIKGLDLRLDRDRVWRETGSPRTRDHDPSIRGEMPRLDPRSRLESFHEVQTGFTGEMAVREAKRCVSCGSCCIQACPYEAIAFDDHRGKAQKCNLCYRRVTNGLYPACADNICLAHCIYFGDPAEIERKIEEKRKLRGGWGEIIPKAITFGGS